MSVKVENTIPSENQICSVHFTIIGYYLYLLLLEIK